MSKNQSENKTPTDIPGITYELDLKDVAKLVFKTSPWLFVVIIAFFASSVGFAFSKFYELKDLITKTDTQIQLLRTEINGNLKLLDQKLDANNSR